MFGISQKKLEKTATNTSVWIGISIATLGILFIIDNLLNIDFFPDDIERFGGAILGVAIVILIAGIFISAMLNVSRIANSFEIISEAYASSKNTAHLEDEKEVEKIEEDNEEDVSSHWGG